MPDPERRRRILILGAAGRDFHCFNTVYRDDPQARVVAFTAAQIPGIDARRYPPALSGAFHPDGVPIVDEAELEEVCAREQVDEVVFAYSDLEHAQVMHLASRALATGADFRLLGPDATMLRAAVPVVAVSAVRTGCGKSQTARFIVRQLHERGLRCVAIRHPMPYGDLAAQRLQRFASRADLAAAHCTAEEREEYESYVDRGAVVYAGVDYAEIVAEAGKEADLIVWDGGNNDFPFLRPDLHLAVVDALRPDQVATHHPGETVARMADVVVLNKVDAAGAADVERATAAVRALRPDVPLLRAASPVVLEDEDRVRGRRVLVVEDGPTTTHGGMGYGAGYVAAVRAGPAEIVDPRRSATPEIAAVFERHPHLQRVLPAMGYGEEQLASLRATIDASDAEVVVSGSPLDLAKLLGVRQPVVRAHYRYKDLDEPGLRGVVDAFLAERGLAAATEGAGGA